MHAWITQEQPGLVLPLLGLLASLCSVALAAELTVPPATQVATMRIILVGDSTVTDESGWGSGFKKLLISQAQCINTAAGGRSSKSFRDEGRWDKAMALKGDFVLIQFGHNDQPGKGPERETDPQTTFRQNMSRYVDEARSAGAKPILVTSLTRRWFSKDGKLRSNLESYAQATRDVAKEKHVPLVDLHARSLALCEKLGQAKADELGPQSEKGPDRTHLNPAGSDLFAAVVADELKRVAPELAPYLK